jgi:hypothetical protein
MFIDQERFTLKGLGDTTRTGYLIGYSETPLGYKVFIPELQTEIIRVHCIFNEVIPDRNEEYYQEIDRMYKDVDSQNAQQEDFDYLVGTTHVDDKDGLEYVVTRVEVVGESKWYMGSISGT